MRFDASLPIDEVLEPLIAHLAVRTNAVLIAPPGAGKTTRVPLVLMDAPWIGGRKILLIEPRRLAARNAAERMARTLGERVGQRVGIRARLGTRVGPSSRIEVVTEGVFTRMLLDDPGLDGVGAVLFDEFHERSLDADFGLALALDAQQGLRPDLRLLVMSATLEGARVADLLGQAPVIESAGRAHPIETRYLGRDATRRLDDAVTDAALRALRVETGSVLVFLPGQAEIRRVAERLSDAIAGDHSIVVAPLYGALTAAEQDAAIAPATPGRRKVVLATSIAETSLTIEGVRVVIDSGLARVPRFEPDIGVTRLETVRASRASVDQRQGRAGRTEPGVCYRLWDEPQTRSLPAFSEPEIMSADLAGLILDCAEWGAIDPLQLAWLDPPPKAALTAATAELQALGAIGTDGRITAEGRLLRSLPLPPRIARMLIHAADLDAARLGSEMAALLVERGLGGNDTDIASRLASFRRDKGRRASDMRRLAAGWALLVEQRASGRQAGDPGPVDEQGLIAACLAAAFPDRIAKARGNDGHFLLANGRAALLDPTDPLSRAAYLVVAEMQGKAAQTRILLAASLSEAQVLAIAGNRIEDRDELAFDEPSASVRARRVRRLGAILLSASPRPLDAEAAEDVATVLADGIATRGIERLPWSKSQLQLRDRVAYLRAAEGDPWPELSDAGLAAAAARWLAPFIQGKSRMSEISAGDLGIALDALLPFELKRRLEEEAPTHFVAPTGNRHPIVYEGAGAPRLAIRVQELFGLTKHPAIVGGRLPLTLELLSPAHRPIQVTRDLPRFWSGSWSEVRAEMRGRYPKHVWPDDPAAAQPTARAKPRNS